MKGDRALVDLSRELPLVGRFGLIGATATLVHMLTLRLLVETTGIPVLLTNLHAFFSAFGISFTGNYFWTFRSPGSAGKTMWRFFVLISGTAFATNTLLLGALLRVGWHAPAVAALLTAAVIPLATYLASRVWVFRE